MSLKNKLSDKVPSAPGGLGLSDAGCFPSLSVKQRVKYFGYSFIGGNVCLMLVRVLPPRDSATPLSRLGCRRAGS